jgi:hypothetical protein
LASERRTAAQVAVADLEVELAAVAGERADDRRHRRRIHDGGAIVGVDAEHAELGPRVVLGRRVAEDGLDRGADVLVGHRRYRADAVDDVDRAVDQELQQLRPRVTTLLSRRHASRSITEAAPR